MATLRINIKNNVHQLSCSDGEEDRLQQLSKQFKEKVEELSLALPTTDDKTLYLIAGLVFLDKIEEQGTSHESKNDSTSQQILLTQILEQTADKIEGLINKYEKDGNIRKTTRA